MASTLDALQDRLGHVFTRASLLSEALTHPSLSGGGNKKKQTSPYERLEFLGDRVLGLVIAHWLYELYPSASEGELAKRHAALVNRDALRLVGEAVGLDQALRLAHGETVGGPRKNLTVLSDAVEAVIGALFLDAGLPVAEAFIRRFWDISIREAKAPADPKTALQEWAQGRGLPVPVYRVVDRSGPAHAPHFKIEVSVKGKLPALAEGNSKREAEKAAATALLKEIEG